MSPVASSWAETAQSRQYHRAVTIDHPAPQGERALMERAVALARQCVGEEGKISPKVGAVVARDGVVLGEAFKMRGCFPCPA